MNLLEKGSNTKKKAAIKLSIVILHRKWYTNKG